MNEPDKDLEELREEEAAKIAILEKEKEKVASVDPDCRS
jgi:hypothetical protein